ncbi:hypothetical protein TRICI_004235 [Trichomonascus ciferrii]|uniref:Uncharacterized protein n=1 Tax=Trichomonascus ciferrii TaxID=44093 RepID=A0A642V2Z4_9ASCO|nr:hypothetical protein TRICI_004235 [Trichomonascus ciferrii]
MNMIYLYVFGLVVAVTLVRSQAFGYLWDMASFPFKTLLLVTGPLEVFCALVERTGMPFSSMLGLYCFAVMYFNIVVCVSILRIPTFLTVLSDAISSETDSRLSAVDQYQAFLADIVGAPVSRLQAALSSKYQNSLAMGTVSGDSPFLNLLLSSALTRFLTDAGSPPSSPHPARQSNRQRAPSRPPPLQSAAHTPPSVVSPTQPQPQPHSPAQPLIRPHAPAQPSSLHAPPYPTDTNGHHHHSRNQATPVAGGEYVDIELPYESDVFYDTDEPSTYDPQLYQRGQNNVSLNSTPPMTAVDEIVIEDDVDSTTGRQGRHYNHLLNRSRSESRGGRHRRSRRTASDNALEPMMPNYTYTPPPQHHYPRSVEKKYSSPQLANHNDYDSMTKIQNPDGSTVNIDTRFLTPKLPINDYSRKRA